VSRKFSVSKRMRRHSDQLAAVSGWQSSKRIETRSTAEYKRSTCEDVNCELKALCVIITAVLKSVIITYSYDLEVVNKTNYQSERRLQYPNTLQYRLERILTMVYVVQNYLASFGLCPSSVCGSFTKDHNVSETGSVSILRWMGQGRPTQLGPTERASLNHWTTVRLPHTRRWTESKRSQIVLYDTVCFSEASVEFDRNTRRHLP
jgi:hypothetical protein